MKDSRQGPIHTYTYTLDTSYLVLVLCTCTVQVHVHVRGDAGPVKVHVCQHSSSQAHAHTHTPLTFHPLPPHYIHSRPHTSTHLHGPQYTAHVHVCMRLVTAALLHSQVLETSPTPSAWHRRCRISQRTYRLYYNIPVTSPCTVPREIMVNLSLSLHLSLAAACVNVHSPSLPLSRTLLLEDLDQLRNVPVSHNRIHLLPSSSSLSLLTASLALHLTTGMNTLTLCTGTRTRCLRTWVP